MKTGLRQLRTLRDLQELPRPLWLALLCLMIWLATCASGRSDIVT
ncbi:MAG: hypothetical protein N2689_02695 [Verrucomicrobiae bacterium]|nr:hypothetical protein [Verrucomicrobiae bacterium]